MDARQRLLGLFLLVVALVLVASATNCAAAQAREKIKVLYPAVGSTPTPLYVAFKEGFYAAENLDVELILMAAGLSVQAVIAGEAHFTAAASSVLPAILAGSGIKLVIITSDRPPWYLVSSPKVGAVSDLKGKRVAVVNRRTLMELSGHDIVRQAGLDPDREVIWVAVPGPGANRMTALVTGAVEAAILASPDNYRVERQGFRRLKFVGENKLIVGGVAAASHLIQQRKDLVDRFVRATIRGLRLLVANREKGVRAFQEFGKVSPEIAAVTYDALAPTFTDNGLTDEATMRATIAKQAEVSGVKSLPVVEQVYDLESVHRALAGLR